MPQLCKVLKYTAVAKQPSDSQPLTLTTKRKRNTACAKEQPAHPESPNWSGAFALWLLGSSMIVGAMQTWDHYTATRTATIVQTELLLHKEALRPTNFDLSCSQGKVLITKHTNQTSTHLAIACRLKGDATSNLLASVRYQQDMPIVEVQDKYDEQILDLVKSGTLVATLKQ